ncbi:MAG: tetraacyldisaccharide 4'-kinase [Fimbriimonadaceae bacterium]
MRSFFEKAWEEKGHVAWILFPLSLLYQLGWCAYLAIYQFGLKKAYSAQIPTICVGNCTAGGSGKTPFTLYLAEALTNRGHQVIISTSGYGSPRYSGAALAPGGELDVNIWGDESTLFRHLLPDMPLIVGHDRVEAAKVAEKNFPNGILLMDDGFQHLRFKAGISLIIDPILENDFCFPAGPYREPLSIGTKRATRVLNYDEDIHPLPLEVTSFSGEKLPKQSAIQALCAIGQPHRFLNGLEAMGFQLKRTKILPDHDPLNAGNLLSEFDPNLPLLVTAKDFVKLKYHPDISRFNVAIVNYRVAPRDPESFFSWIESKIDELKKEKIPR